ncbi:MAG TPA: adenosylmethionine--8-amino-7-oxononanoate transaminase [Pirellulales bacterium]|nr:adenosylmethionine--8-amino-7-oxononanoate transaminase [Pirellulales bacterium]
MSAPTRDELDRWDREHVWHAFTQMAEYEPLLIERAEGCTLVDVDGRAYLDGTSSLWCNVHGHRQPQIDAAVREQLDRVAHTTLLGQSNPIAVRLARRLVELAPDGLEKVFFSDDGATAVEVALKMAFQYWRQRPDPRPEKTRFLALGEAYHGDTLGSVAVGGVERFHALFAPLLFEVVRLPAPQTDRLPRGVSAESALRHYLAQLDQALAEHHERLAAMVIEPLVQCAAGMLVHPEGYLRGARELTRRYGVLLIADEVAVGFGRTGRLFACEHESVSPDFLCLAKGLTGGYLPLAATLTTSEIWSAFLGRYEESRQFYHGHTYGGNPLGAAAALASLDIFDDQRVLEGLPAKIGRLAERLARIARAPHVGDVRQRGMIAGIELVAERTTAKPYPWGERRGWRVCRHARRLGVLVRPLGDVVVIFPPLAISLDELDRLCAAVEEGIAVATEEEAEG